MLHFLTGRHIRPSTKSDENSDKFFTEYDLTIDGDEWALRKASTLLYSGTEAGELIGVLMDSVMFDLADPCDNGMMLHAAALSWKDKGILFPGVSGAGKSTLSAWLSSAGFDYLTDEMVFVPANSVKLNGFNRPIQLKLPLASPIEATVNQYIRKHRQDVDYFRNERGLLIPSRAISQSNIYRRADTTLLIFPEYRDDTEFSLQKLTRAHSAMKLMSCLINARNLDRSGLSATTFFSHQVTSYKMTYSDLSTARAEIISLLSN